MHGANGPALLLRSVVGWHDGMTCVPTALAAVTGASVEVVANALAEEMAVARTGKVLPSYNRQHWVPAIDRLGLIWLDGAHFDYLPFLQRPTIGDWMRAHPQDEAQLVHCSDASGNYHVFATENGMFVDVYTSGERQSFREPPTPYNEFRVLETFGVISQTQ